ncbi:plasmid segregation protein ParM [Eubacterium uniforme]|uniref:Plasmid segregation protein ParM n=1 Tax=Eubacterium uniforme TaxID=39495 RepID=A0A1T4V7X4_9FIRM|nr:ParM/StbA family protein [Eubacterium uniforme]SKA60972.1 plasmid segregation protein ParM [Eubacterium uniforme]
MIKKNEKTYIGIDHGYGFMKTSKTIFKSGIKEQPIEPPFSDDILIYDNRVFVIGQNRTEHGADKTTNEEYFILTLAALARELKKERMAKASNVVLCVGLPYSFFTEQKDKFKKYLLKNRHLDFKFEGKRYLVDVKEVKVFPQGFPAIAEKFGDYLSDKISIVDFGSRTIDVITFNEGKALHDQCFSVDKKGTLELINEIRKFYMNKYAEDISEDMVQDIFQNKKVSLSADKVKFVQKLIRLFLNNYLEELRAKGIADNVIYCGGGSTVIKNYVETNKSTTDFVENIFFNASGYELLASR